MDSNHRNVHAAIKEVFGYPNILDNNPRISSIKYSRKTFAILFKRLNYTKGAEIGVRKGNLSKMLCRTNPQLKMYCIDPWAPYTDNLNPFNKRYTQEKQDQIYAHAVKNLEPYDVVLIRKPSMDALDDFEDNFLDFVYIDGNHTFDYVAMDIICWAHKVKHGGIIACHDYHGGTWAGVMQAVDAYTFCHKIDPWYVTKEAQPTAYWVNP